MEARILKSSFASLLILCLGVGLTGCGHLAYVTDNQLNINGAQQLAANSDAARRVDLVTLIAYSSRTTTNVASQLGPDCADGSAKDPWYENSIADRIREGETGRRCLERAAQIFYMDPLYQPQRRDAIQARLIAAARTECKHFTEHLNSIHAYGNLIPGILATLAGAAGAITTHEATARALAGTAAFFSGARAEFNADIFLQQAVPTLVKAIKTSQDGYLRDTIYPSRQKGIEVYTLWDAIGDAFRFSDMCSLVAGLGTLDKSLQVADDPGLDAMSRYFVKFNTNRQIIEKNIIDTSTLNQLGGAGTLVALGGIASGAANLSAALPVDAYSNAEQVLIAGGAQVTQALARLKDRTDTGGGDPSVTATALTNFQCVSGTTIDSFKPKVYAELQATTEAAIVLQKAQPADQPQKRVLLAGAQAEAAKTAQDIASLTQYISSAFTSATAALAHPFEGLGTAKKDDGKPFVTNDTKKAYDDANTSLAVCGIDKAIFPDLSKCTTVKCPTPAAADGK